MKQSTILLVEAEIDLLLTGKNLLESNGYCVYTARAISEARTILSEITPDLIVSEIILPDGCGFEFCQEIRETNPVPVLFLSYLSAKHKIIKGLRMGADDYLIKPYDSNEFLARCEALVRRTSQPIPHNQIIVIANLTIDIYRGKVLLDGADILLKPREFKLLLFFIQHPNEYFTSNKLFETVWDMPANDDVRTVKAHVYRLRQKIKQTENSTFSIKVKNRQYYWSVKNSGNLA